eukprot:CAMPEP_0184337244 /NCGR_PEP_ID=MMETSP1089-20130417/5607_1 /TAXON_ID=38269 ORGANISM="Gloeochaete wittrockiana, Strain SAG46.84" /NCGR_SAMPLE_ID=MMETSP1089 /ASSEMBLY_ACC=CAM_ASM_000445 /LENGTH=143 /DNA_ID=CAMNT_0026662815 /DNA_START=32 /DNA_END=463 /DNA_ORIENTATION=+
MARFADPNSVRAAITEIFQPHSYSGWVIVNYADPSTLVLAGKGTGGVAEIVPHLKADDAQYILVRIEDSSKETLAKTTRDVFIAWMGPGVSIVAKGKKKSHVGTAKGVLNPFHAELEAINIANFNEETVREKSRPLSGSHVID